MGTGRNWNALEICAAVLVYMELCRMPQMAGPDLHRESSRSFYQHVKRIMNHILFKDFKDVPKEGDRDGEQIWNKQKEARADMTNVIGPLFHKAAPGPGQPMPSGKHMDELLLTVKKDYFEEQQTEKERVARQTAAAGAAKGVGKRVVTTVQVLAEASGACTVDDPDLQGDPKLDVLVWMTVTAITKNKMALRFDKPAKDLFTSLKLTITMSYLNNVPLPFLEKWAPEENNIDPAPPIVVAASREKKQFDPNWDGGLFWLAWLYVGPAGLNDKTFLVDNRNADRRLVHKHDYF